MSTRRSIPTAWLSWATLAAGLLLALPAWGNNAWGRGPFWDESIQRLVGYITCGMSVLSLVVLGGVGLFYQRTRRRRPISNDLVLALLWVPISEGMAGVILLASSPGLDLFFRLVAGIPFLVTGAGCIMLSRLMGDTPPKQAAAQAAAFVLICASAPYLIIFIEAFFADP